MNSYRKINGRWELAHTFSEPEHSLNSLICNCPDTTTPLHHKKLGLGWVTDGTLRTFESPGMALQEIMAAQQKENLRRLAAKKRKEGSK
jgi:hypothetical protein